MSKSSKPFKERYFIMVLGVCQCCKKRFVFTGEVETVAACECGHKHQQSEIVRGEAYWPTLMGWLKESEYRVNERWTKSFIRIEERERAAPCKGRRQKQVA